MSNKKIFKNLYSIKINKDNNYNQILNKISSKKDKYNLHKKIFIPITSISLILILILIPINKSSNLKVHEEIKDYNSYTNQNLINTYSTTSKENITINDIEYNELIKQKEFTFIKNISIPSDLNNKIYQEVKENNVLKNYTLTYKNNNDRLMSIHISNKYKFIKDNCNKDNIINMKINNQEYNIYQSANIYNLIFSYNNINFYIETTNITYDELINILKSIIK